MRTSRAELRRLKRIQLQTKIKSALIGLASTVGVGVAIFAAVYMLWPSSQPAPKKTAERPATASPADGTVVQGGNAPAAGPSPAAAPRTSEPLPQSTPAPSGGTQAPRTGSESPQGGQSGGGQAAAPAAPAPKPEPAVQGPVKVAEAKAGHFTLGSTAREVETILGKPELIVNYRFTDDEWQYGKSIVYFDANRYVIGWVKAEGVAASKFPVDLGAPAASAAPFKLGSTRGQVASAMGTPDAIRDYGRTGSSWHYGQSRVDFDADGLVKGIVNPTGNLKAVQP